MSKDMGGEVRGRLKPTAADLRQLKRDNAAWPDALTPVPSEQWPIPPFKEESVRLAVYRSRKFLVQLFRDVGGGARLSVNRTEFDERKGSWREDISWDDLQRLKAEAGFGDAWAIEVYPPDDAVVNVANMRHIWLTGPVKFAWNATPLPNRSASVLMAG